MGWGGSVSQMILTLRTNKDILGSRRKEFKLRNEYNKVAEKIGVSYQEATPEQLKEIRQKVKRQNFYGRIKAGIVVCVCMPLIILIGGFIVEAVQNEIPLSEEESLMLFYEKVAKGDAFLKYKKTKSAYAFYSRANEYVPGTELIKVRKCLLKLNNCFYFDYECNQLENALNRLDYTGSKEYKRLNELIGNCCELKKEQCNSNEQQNIIYNSVFDEFFERK